MQGRRLVLGALLGSGLAAIGMLLAPREPYLAIIPLLLGFILGSPLALFGASDGWPEISMVPWPVLAMNIIGWALAFLLVGGWVARRKAAAS